MQERIRARHAKLAFGSNQNSSHSSGGQTGGKAMIPEDDLDLDDPLGIICGTSSVWGGVGEKKLDPPGKKVPILGRNLVNF